MTTLRGSNLAPEARRGRRIAAPARALAAARAARGLPGHGHPFRRAALITICGSNLDPDAHRRRAGR
ncbi:hypothetical protein GCM10022380_11060 [Amycolatopsis tucumanensis]|uniref:Uncharacterized protein n=1 Tax=Amycolatopsis tucumanensis TaxID=401106 RepID=A0ABP7HID1_9PSEU